MAFASLSETKQALIIDHDDDDATLLMLIIAASEAVESFVKPQPSIEVPERLKVATILTVKHLYGNDAGFEGGQLPASVRALLTPLRTPTLR